MTSSAFAEKRHCQAVLYALLVTFLWSTSWVLIKTGLQDIPALTFAGLRYSLAFLCLLPFAFNQKLHPVIVKMTGRQWSLLVLLGVLYYALVQGAQYLGLSFLPATMTSLILNFTSVMVAFMGMFWLSERPGLLGWGGDCLVCYRQPDIFLPRVYHLSRMGRGEHCICGNGCQCWLRYLGEVYQFASEFACYFGYNGQHGCWRNFVVASRLVEPGNTGVNLAELGHDRLASCD